MFEKASRLKLRFETTKGSISVEDLWDISLVGKSLCLDNIAKLLFRKLKASDVESFVLKSPKADDLLKLRFDIVKYVIDVRLKEAELAEQAKTRKEKKQKILAIMADKEDQTLRDASLEDLKKMLEDL